MVNFTCPVKPHLDPDPVPFFSKGNINFKAHDVGWIVCGFFSLISCTASFWLILRHLKYYTCPPQQRHIVRMLFMVPVYSLVSFASYLFYTEALYYQVIRDCYEAVTITSFFFLLLQYVGDTPEEQHFVFKQVKLKKWFWPLGCWNYRPDGLKFLWLMKICILQYAIFRPLCTVLTVGMQYFGVYCLESWMPWFGHFWMAATITVSVSVAMYCVVQFYLPISEELKPYEPVLKFLAVKAVVFLTFWQESFLSMLVVFGAIKDAAHWNTEQIVVGYAAILSCFEMVIFAFLHIRAFSYRPYRPEDHTKTTRRLRAFGHVLDFRDWFWQMKLSSKWAAANRKGEDFTLVDEIRARKYDHLMRALGKERTMDLQDFRDQRREELMAHFWKHPTDAVVDEKGTEVGDGLEKKTGPKAERPDGGLYTVAELQQQAKRESRLAHSRQSSRDGKSKSGKTKPEADELRRLASVLDNQEEGEEQEGDDTDVNDSLIQSKDRPSRRDTRAQTGYLDPHPELTVYHAPILPADFELFSPETEGEKGFAEELEDEYKARGLWGIGSDNSRGGYVLTNLADDPAAAARSQGHRKQKSWWRALRERISGSGVEEPKGIDYSDRWQGVQVDSTADYEEPRWLERDGFTLPGPRRSSLAVGALASPTDSDAVPLEHTFVRVSGHRVNNPGLPMQVSRKAVPIISPSLQEARSVISADASGRAGQHQPWLLQQHQSPLTKVITSQIQGRDSSLTVQGAAVVGAPKSASQSLPPTEFGFVNRKSEQPIFHPARPTSVAQSIESGSSLGQNSQNNSATGGPYRNKSMSASIRLLSEAGTFGATEQDDVAAAEDEVAKVFAPESAVAMGGAPTLGHMVQADGAERAVNVLERSDSAAVASSKQASVSRCTSSAQRTNASPLVGEDAPTFSEPYPNQLVRSQLPSRAEKRRAPQAPANGTNVTSAQRAAFGPKGRPISIVMPGVLSSTHNPYDNFQSSPSEMRSVSASAASSSNPSQPGRPARAEKALRARTSEPVSASAMPRSPDQAASSRSGLAVGNIVSRATIADAQWAPQLQEKRAEEQRRQSSRPSKPSHSSKHSLPPSGRPQDRDSTQPRPHRSQRTSSANTMGRDGMPLNAVGAMPSSSASSSSHRRSNNGRMGPPHYQRPSDQQVQHPRASFHPYTGEPVWTDGYGRSVSRDWVAAHGPIQVPNATGSGTIRSNSPPRSELELNGGFGRIEYID